MATKRGLRVNRRPETLAEWQDAARSDRYVTRGELMQWIRLTRYLPLHVRMWRRVKRAVLALRVRLGLV